MEYFIDYKQTHLDDLYFHLRKHNKSFTGEKASEVRNIYVVKNDKLLGSIQADLGWDWVSINQIYYQDLDVLKELIAKACEVFKGRVLGLKIVSEDRERHNDFIRTGFTDIGNVKGTPKSNDTYFAHLLNLDISQNLQFHTISSKEIVVEYDNIVQEKVKEYNLEHNIKEHTEEILYVALDKEIFVGGIKLELSEDSMYIDLLAVNNDYKGQQVGTKLMEFAEEEARKRGFYSISVGTTEFQARPFYEKLGYEVVFTRHNCPKGYAIYSLNKLLK